MYRTVYELTEEELEELRDAYYWQCLDDGAIDVDDFDGIPDSVLFDHYDGIMFVEDDFFCNQSAVTA